LKAPTRSTTTATAAISCISGGFPTPTRCPIYYAAIVPVVDERLLDDEIRLSIAP